MHLETALTAIACSAIAAVPTGAQSGSGTSTQPQHGAAVFIENLGQWDERALFAAHFGGTAVFLEERGWTATFDNREASTSVQMVFGGSGRADVEPAKRLSGIHNYFVGSADLWRTGARRFEEVRYSELYSGIGLRCYGLDGHLEYDLELAPGADLGEVEIRVLGAIELCAERDGSISMETAAGVVRLSAPFSWEEGASGRRPIASRYELRGSDRIGFSAEWSGDVPMVLDPGLIYGTYLGGGGLEDEGQMGVSADDGVVTFAGTSLSTDYPISVGAYQLSRSGVTDAVVTRIDTRLPAAQQLLFSTYLGGTSRDTAVAVDVGSGGVVTVAGDTLSHNFPTSTDAVDKTLTGPPDVFVAQLDPALPGIQQLVYSTYMGGSGQESGLGMWVEPSGRISVGGATTSTDFPTTFNGLQKTYGGGPRDGFMFQIDPTVPAISQFRYSTYWGGVGDDEVSAITVDVSGAVTFGGLGGTGLPVTAAAWMPGKTTGLYLVILDPSFGLNNQLLYATYFGGTGTEGLGDVFVNETGTIAMFGQTNSADYPTTSNAWSDSLAGEDDLFLTLLEPLSSPQVPYSTYLGGRRSEGAVGVHVDRARLVTMSGWTTGIDFPRTAGAFSGGVGGVVVRMDPFRPVNQQLFYASEVGAPGATVSAMGVDLAGQVAVAGNSAPSGVIVSGNALQPVAPGASDYFVTVLDMLPEGVSIFGAASPGCAGYLTTGVSSAPQLGNSNFSIYCTNASPSSPGTLFVGVARQTPGIPILGVQLLVNLGLPLLTLPVASSARGSQEIPIPLPSNAALVGGALVCQYLFAEPTSPGPCPPLGLSASNGLEVIIQP